MGKARQGGGGGGVARGSPRPRAYRESGPD